MKKLERHSSFITYRMKLKMNLILFISAGTLYT
jgi:hypothetical protein